MRITLVRTLLFTVLATTSAPMLGCSADVAPVEADEQALTEAKVLARGITSPSGLAVAGNHIYFGSNTFVASGDAELDQEFAYWEGKFARVPLTGGRQELVADVGPISLVKASGAMLYYAMPQGCWIGKLDTAKAGAPKPQGIYQYEACETDTGRGIQHFDIADRAIYIVEDDGKIVRTDLNGKNAKSIGQSLVSGWGGTVASAALGRDAMFIATNTSGAPPAIYRVALDTGRASKVMQTGKTIYDLETDGENLFWAAEDGSIRRLREGATADETIATGFGSIVDMAIDGTNVFVADAQRGAVYIVADAAGRAVGGAPKAKKKLAAVRGINELTVAKGIVYVGSNVVEGRKALGVIAAIKTP